MLGKARKREKKASKEKFFMELCPIHVDADSTNISIVRLQSVQISMHLEAAKCICITYVLICRKDNFH